MFWIGVILLVVGAKLIDAGRPQLGFTLALSGVFIAWLPTWYSRPRPTNSPQPK